MNAPPGSALKNQVSMSDFEIEAQSIDTSSQTRLLRAVNALRSCLTWLAVAVAIVVLGLSADALHVYNVTSVAPQYQLQLWPEAFDIRPTQAFVAGSVVVAASHIATQLAGEIKAPARYSHRGAYAVVGTLFSLIGAVAAIGFYYSANGSDAVDTVQSWSCRWASVPMSTKPHFGTLCKESRIGLTLATLLVPLEVMILAISGFQMTLDKKVGHLLRK